MTGVRRPLRVPVTVLIIALILALAAPSLAFAGILLLQSDNVNRQTMSYRAQQGLGIIAEAVDRELRNMTTNLSVLAASGWVETAEYDRLHARATRALSGTDTFLVAVDGDLNQILNTRAPWGTPLQQLSEPEFAKVAIETGLPTVSNTFIGRIAQEPVFNLTLPIISQEFRVKALILSRNTDTLTPIFEGALPLQGWAYAILDRDNKLVVGAAPADGSADVLAQLCGVDAEGLQQVKTERVSYSADSEKLAAWGWRACVWTSSDQVEASISQRWRIFTMVVLVIVAVTILSGAAMGQMLAGAIRRAATVGRALDAGGTVPETHSLVGEVDDVLGTLTRAARRRLQQEEELRVLLHETAHRAKNQIAISAALVRLSARSAENVDQLRDDISARLSALGRSIDMMSANASGAAPLAGLVAAQLEPFAVDQPGRLELSGAAVSVSPATAQALGLTLHELATNAAKYGAWSTPEGRVRVEWSKAGAALQLIWTEQGGPRPDAAPLRTGFGSSLIEMMIERNLGGTVARDFRDTGLVVRLTLQSDGGLPI